QLDRIEQITNENIKQNLTVYAKEVPLNEARKVPGLRAVFGEVYPDPVRVVSIGADIDEIMKTIDNEKWARYSVEFCGGTHVPKTGEIKLFSILEEGSIAKGIRRIIAVTGEEAHKAHLLAQSFEAELDKLETMSGPELEAALRKTGAELDTLVVSAYTKHIFRQRFNAIRSKFFEADKVAKAAKAKAAIDKLKERIESDSDTKYLVQEIDVDGNSKAMSNVATYLKSLNGDQAKAVLFVSIDRANGRVAHQSVVPKPLVDQGLDAKAWATEVSKIVGGKCGGKKEFAQGSGTNVDKVDEALKIAEEFAKLKLSL
ncbi:Alanine--tRNA ligase, partial [Spiromyces aspiralis]